MCRLSIIAAYVNQSSTTQPAAHCPIVTIATATLSELPLIFQFSIHAMLKFFRKGRKSLPKVSFFQRFRKWLIRDSELGSTHWNLPLPPDIMYHIIDSYNDIPNDIPTILALAQSYPVLRPFCFSKIFQNLHISTRSLLTFEFLANVIQEHPFVLERMESLTLEGQFKRKELTGSSYVLSQITERSHNLVRLCLSYNYRWEKSNKTLRKHILILLSQSRLHSFALWPYGIPVELLSHLPDLKRFEITPLFEIMPSASDAVPVWGRQVKVEELVLIGIDTFRPPLDFSSLFDFSSLKVFEVQGPWRLTVQEVLKNSAASLRKLDLDLYDDLGTHCVFPTFMINRGKQISILVSFLASNTSHYLSGLTVSLKRTIPTVMSAERITHHHRPNSNSSQERWLHVNPTTTSRRFAFPSIHVI